MASACGNDWRTGSAQAAAGTEGPAPVTEDLNLGATAKVPVNAPGVSDTEIRVGGIASIAGNPVSGKYGNAFKGVQAYFEMVNARGGIYGRKLVLAAAQDDKMFANSTEVERLVGGKDSFAILPVASPLFTGADQLLRENVPTFGWYINAEWAGTPATPKLNLFGQSGSNPCIDCAFPFVPWIAKETGRRKLGLLAYGVPQSAGCAAGSEKSVEKYGRQAGLTLAFSDKAMAYGVSDLSAQVSKMKAAGVDIIWTCMDTNAVVTLAREAHRQGLDAIQLLPNAYDHEFLEEYGDLFEGSYLRTDFVPFEVDPKPAGVQRFLEWMGKSGSETSENAIVGWLNADLFVAGLVAAGPNFSRQGLIDAINTKLTNYTADGMLPGVDWSKAHIDPVRCFVVSKIESGAFVPSFGVDGKPFVCPDEKGGQLVSDASGGS
jgi:branched-chain amino acid transport system substrate-binding protein